MTDQAILSWIKENLSPDIIKALAQYPATIFTESDLAGLTCRETGILIARYAPVRPAMSVLIISSLMRGDYSQRAGEFTASYHGYGFPQIDIASFPDFVRSGDWKIPYKAYMKCLGVLADKKTYLSSKFQGLEASALKHAVLAAYNEGQGNAAKALNNHLDPDAYTTHHDYASAVEGYSVIYANL